MTMRERRDRGGDLGSMGLQERVVSINRVAKVVKGGRNFSFNALVVVGDGSGQVGIGLGKAGEVPEAVRKGTAIARRNMVPIVMEGSTIPHEVFVKFSGAKVLLKPAGPGTGVIAGASVRAVVTAAGIRDVLTKVVGSRNPINVVKATFKALEDMRNPAQAVAARKELAEAQRASPPPEPRSPRPPRPTPPRRDRDQDDRRPSAGPRPPPPAAPAEPAPAAPSDKAAAAPVAEASPAAPAEPAPDEPSDEAAAAPEAGPEASAKDEPAG